jgi:hypothetical protein
MDMITFGITPLERKLEGKFYPASVLKTGINHDTEMNLRVNVLSAFVSSGMNVMAKIDQ